MAKSFFDVLGREFTRGLGRKAGFQSWKAVEKQLGDIVINPNNPFRKQIERFQLPGTFKGGVSKIYTLIDSFNHEYTTNTAMYQKSTYLLDDILFIEEKINFLERLVTTEAEERAYDRLIDTWKEIRNNHTR